MAFERKDMTFALFPNNRKRSDKAPDYQGSVKIDGVEYELAGWKKEGKNGKFVSGTLKPPQGAQQRQQAQEFDDDIGF